MREQQYQERGMFEVRCWQEPINHDAHDPLHFRGCAVTGYLILGHTGALCRALYSP